ncbi:hypothetical protein A33M_3672 [Rhodovulum sp. PH10]|nr:hypothetical protein A33M_3672 [Rhodovulum sp. PH10]
MARNPDHLSRRCGAYEIERCTDVPRLARERAGGSGSGVPGQRSSRSP